MQRKKNFVYAFNASLFLSSQNVHWNGKLRSWVWKEDGKAEKVNFMNQIDLVEFRYNENLTSLNSQNCFKFLNLLN